MKDVERLKSVYEMSARRWISVAKIGSSVRQ